jgi:hypothetical protein
VDAVYARGARECGGTKCARAALAPKPRHAVFRHAARQKLPELALDELRQARWWSTVCSASRGR